jgi:F-type H+-transporting ATPase subunit b
MLSLITLAAGAEAAEPKLLWLDAEGWVYVALTIFIVVFGAKIWGAVSGALDSRIADTRRSLDEAQAIRAEAEALLAAAKQQIAASAAEAAAILHTARAEAEGILAKAETDAAATMKRREKMANDKIGAAERAAIEHIRTKAGNAAIAVATDVIRADHRADNDRDLVSGAIAGM